MSSEDEMDLDRVTGSDNEDGASTTKNPHPQKKKKKKNKGKLVKSPKKNTNEILHKNTEEVMEDAGSSGAQQLTEKQTRDAQQQDSLPWVEKYRPKDFSELVAHEDITNTIQRLIDQNRLPHLLFYGPPGTGKTSTILACARRLYGPNYHSMVLELNASDDRGIDVVREQIKDFASTRKIFSSGIKLVILDEADAMTNAAQAALRRVIEKFTKNTRFCLICNYISKIIPALQSRCTRFRFGPIPKDAVSKRLNHVIECEG
jgi:replication factor C subunit 3/5